MIIRAHRFDRAKRQTRLAGSFSGSHARADVVLRLGGKVGLNLLAQPLATVSAGDEINKSSAKAG